MRFILRWIINIVALLLVTRVVPGVMIESTFALVVAALVLGVFNAIIRPAIILVTLPLTILSLGIFTLFINAFIFSLTARIVSGFSVTGFWSAFWGALLFSIVNFLITLLVKPSGTGRVFFSRPGRPPRNPRYPGAIDVDATPTGEPKKDERKKLT